MRQYSDKSMILVLAQEDEPAPEADYPIDLDFDTSVLLDNEGNRP